MGYFYDCYSLERQYIYIYNKLLYTEKGAIDLEFQGV